VTVVVEQVDVEQVRQLRHEVLRGPTFAWSESVYPADDDAATIHLAARDRDRVVGCATWFPEPLESEPAWRLRGMAVAPDRQGTGVGTLIMAASFERLAALDADLLWCNARMSALPFYEAHGFRRVGGTFPSVGGIPHTVAVRHLGRPHLLTPTPSR
jgi:GNAT superfamily N-acetyltransferase